MCRNLGTFLLEVVASATLKIARANFSPSAVFILAWDFYPFAQPLKSWGVYI